MVPTSLMTSKEQRDGKTRTPAAKSAAGVQKPIACEVYSAFGTIASVVMRSDTSSLTFGA